MTYIKHESINNSQQLPFKIFSFRAHNLERVIPMHWHQSTEILFCAKGNLEVRLKENNYFLKKNDFLVINPYQIHSTKSLTINWILCIQLPLVFLNKITANKFLKNFIFDANSCKYKKVHDRELIKIMTYIINLQEQPTNLVKNLKILTEVVDLVRVLTEYYSKKNNIALNKNDINFIEELTNYISTNSSKDLKLKDISTHFSYSNGYTSRLIKKNLGTSFLKLLRIIRINKAIDLMNNSHDSWLKIANETGFQTYRNLYNTFKKIYHLSPEQFKREQKK